MIVVLLDCNGLHQTLGITSEFMDLFAPGRPLATGVSEDPSSVDSCLHRCWELVS